MTITEALQMAKKSLKKYLQKDDTPNLDAEVLLADILSVSRTYLFAHGNTSLSQKNLKKYSVLLKKRTFGTPISHLLHRKEFFGLEFYVDEHVLTPRPETEILVEKALEILKNFEKSTILDIGTGSGCIAISLRKYLPACHQMYAIDISEKALKIARKNARLLHASYIIFKKSNLLKNIRLPKNTPCPVLVLANLPYIPKRDILPVEVKKYDPKIALLSGNDGLSLYRRFFQELQKFPCDMCIFEFSQKQKLKIKKIVLKHFPHAKLSIFPKMKSPISLGILALNPCFLPQKMIQ
ncbi:peptide chain release factor N(5)-glutamine methyltransferase [Candidatus Peregrinibacteria bacterium]|nr:peptide chain release factor N(5)-glutamine methyltransferase [Candidatus Peregrinibacteria bacterium]